MGTRPSMTTMAATRRMAASGLRALKVRYAAEEMKKASRENMVPAQATCTLSNIH